MCSKLVMEFVNVLKRNTELEHSFFNTVYFITCQLNVLTLVFCDGSFILKRGHLYQFQYYMNERMNSTIKQSYIRV